MARAEKVIDLHVQCDDEGVESGGHEDLLVDDAMNTADFGRPHSARLPLSYLASTI
jgi:hypothetical protein